MYGGFPTEPTPMEAV
ncbi:hypothetical protein LEMLEM_LOCUS7635 [Lemmus lemmus]